MINFFKSGIYRKITLFFTIIVIVSISLTFIISKFVILESFKDLEETNIAQNLDKLENSINLYTDNLNKTCKDWASWDDTYDFIQDSNRDFLNSNFADPYSTMKSLNVDMMFFLNRSGKIIYSKNFDPLDATELPVPGELKKYFESDDMFLEFGGSDINKSIQGIMKIENKIALVSSNPVLTSTDKGPSRGSLIMVSILDDEIGQIQELTGNKLELKSISNYAEDFTFTGSATTDILGASVSDLYGIKLSDLKILNAYTGIYYTGTTYKSFKIIKDIFGNPSILIKSSGKREIYNYGQREFRNINIIILLSTIIIILVTLLIINKGFLRRISKLEKEVESIGESKKHKNRLTVIGNDEISSLEKNINLMLDKIEKAQDDASQAQTALFDMFDRSLDGVYRSTPDGRYLYINNSLTRMLGYDSKEELMKINTSELYANPADRPDPTQRDKTFNTCLKRKDGSKIYVEISSRVSIKNSRPAHYDGIVRDVTESKNYEEKIKYLSFHDKLTGLFNRAYFDEEIKRLKKSRQLPITIVFCDMNGLKKVNDSLGHQKGDLLLKKFAKILKDCFRSEDIVARIGGDEFCIILLNTADEDAEKIIVRVQEKCARETKNRIVIDFAHGIKSKMSQDENIYKILKIAEVAMYENKKEIYSRNDSI
jgi:diguanylate cyclase (GGDEF)-like protein/PAS domain S-box-containing protein